MYSSLVDSIGSSTGLGGVGVTGGRDNLSDAGVTGCGNNISYTGLMDSGTNVSSCSLSASVGAVITSSVLGGALGTGSGSSSLGVSDSFSGTSVALTRRRLSIGV